MNTFLQVAIGGAIGSVARYSVNIIATRLVTGFPLGTLAVNITGCFIMGLLATVLAYKGGHALAPLLLTGVLGGFTTFSAFSLDTLTLWERGATGLALAYLLASVLFSLMAVTAGMALGRGIFA